MSENTLSIFDIKIIKSFLNELKHRSNGKISFKNRRFSEAYIEREPDFYVYINIKNTNGTNDSFIVKFIFFSEYDKIQLKIFLVMIENDLEKEKSIFKAFSFLRTLTEEIFKDFFKNKYMELYEMKITYTAYLNNN